jgi:hypothetical protein
MGRERISRRLFVNSDVLAFSAYICEDLRPNIPMNIGEMPELAEGARLEIVCPAKSGTVGSNPTLSARKNDNGTQINADFQDIKNSKSHQIEKEARKIL